MPDVFGGEGVSPFDVLKVHAFNIRWGVLVCSVRWVMESASFALSTPSARYVYTDCRRIQYHFEPLITDTAVTCLACLAGFEEPSEYTRRMR